MAQTGTGEQHEGGEVDLFERIADAVTEFVDGDEEIRTEADD